MRKDFGGADNVPFLVVGSGYTDTVNFQNYTKLYILCPMKFSSCLLKFS